MNGDMMIGSTIILLSSQPPTVPLYDLEGNIVEEIQLPPVFGLIVRKDLIKRAYLSAFTARLQPKGRDPLAGKRTTARSFGVGLGIARVPRIPGTGRAALINSAVGGRLAFPPTPEKKLHEEINKKEMKLAVASALAATARPEFVKMRGHRVPEDKKLPIIIVDEFEKLSKAREVREVLKKIGLWDDIERAKKNTRIRAGKGKMRGRRYKKPKSILVIVSNPQAEVTDVLDNFPGVDVASPWSLNILHLAPGGVPGRLTLITAQALNELAKRFEVLMP